MKKSTYPVSDNVFSQVYDSPAALPGKHKWTTPCEDVRQIEALLGVPENTIGAPLWLSGDSRACTHCQRQISWLDIVASALDRVHTRDQVARVILGEQKYVNTETPRAIVGLKCFQCKAEIGDLRSFKCHNWAYAAPELLDLLQRHPSPTKPASKEGAP